MILAANPFISAYLQSDGLGKILFWALFLLSALSWSVLLHKGWIFLQVKRLSKEFAPLFSEKDPFGLQVSRPLRGVVLQVPHPFFEIYRACKSISLQILTRNYSPEEAPSLSEADLELIEAEAHTAIAANAKKLEKNLFLLSTAVTLAPFLGLLGTVWGILLTFSQMGSKGMAMSHPGLLSGLSLALATTVIGLLIAIPALIGHNVLKNAGREYRREMEGFSQRLLRSIELQYRKPVHATKTLPPS